MYVEENEKVFSCGLEKRKIAARARTLELLKPTYVGRNPPPTIPKLSKTSKRQRESVNLNKSS